MNGIVADKDFASATPVEGEASAALALGAELFSKGEYRAAIEAFARSIAVDPTAVAPYANAAAGFAALGAVDEAVEWMELAAGLAPENPEILRHLGTLYARAGRESDALSAFASATSLAADDVDLLNVAGLMHAERKEWSVAIRCFERALALYPDARPVRCNLASAFLEVGRFEDAEAAYSAVLSAVPDDLDALVGSARCMILQLRHAEALDFADRALTLVPDHVAALKLAGVAAMKLGELTRAVEFFCRVIEAAGKDADSFNNLAIVFRQLGRLEAAEENFRLAVAESPDNVEARFNLASMMFDRQRYLAALEEVDALLAVRPDDHEGAVLKGKTLRKIGRPNDARRVLAAVVEADPENGDASMELAHTLEALGSYPAARELYDGILERDPENLAALNRKGLSFRAESALREAEACFLRALEISDQASGVRMNLASILGDQGRFDESERHFARVVAETRDPGLLSGYLMSLHYNPARTQEEIFREHLRWGPIFTPAGDFVRPVPSDRDPDRRLRIGLMSGGFRQHPVGAMVTLGLENLPADQFELYFYSTSQSVDEITKRLKATATSWKLIDIYDDDVVEALVRKDEIDILIELSGHAAGNRLKVIAREPAPVIIKWVGGLFNTTGIPAVDHLISDAIETPEGHDEFYTEKLIRLPDDYICYMPPAYAPPVREAPVLRNGYITFGCFNNPIKTNPTGLAQWARILTAVPSSRLLLKSKHYAYDEFNAPILEVLAQHGVSADRIDFEGESSHVLLMDSYNRIDIALDPWPYSGGLTTCEALWMGVPVITYPGPTFAGRHSATHLVNAGFPDFVCASWDEYVDKAVALASDHARLAELRPRIRPQVQASPLCDGPRFGTNLAAALRKTWQDYVRKLDEDPVVPPAPAIRTGSRRIHRFSEVSELERAAPAAETVFVLPSVDTAAADRVAQQIVARSGVEDFEVIIFEDRERRGFIKVANDVFANSAGDWFGYVAEDAFAGREWLRIAHAAMADGGDVFAFNDGKWFGKLAAFGMVRRSWVRDLYGGLFHPAYHSHYADTELSVVAAVMGVLRSDPESLLVEVDYEKEKKAVNPDDKALFHARRADGFGIGSRNILYPSAFTRFS